MVESGVVSITSDEALEVMALCKGRGFEGLKVRERPRGRRVRK